MKKILVDRTLLDKQVHEMGTDVVRIPPSQKTIDGVYNLLTNIWDSLEEDGCISLEYCPRLEECHK